jgi:DNA-directed RNA polymerase subunit RPC12/RpoP
VCNGCISVYNGCEILPQKVICEKCGAVLYEGLELKPPDEIIQTNNGKCPKCGKKISFVPKKVLVRSAEETGRKR